MKIEKQYQEDHQMVLTVEVEQELMESSKRRAARQMAQRGKIPGFRPGKAPYDVIVRYFGESAIVEQAMELLIDEIYPKVLDEAEIKPAAPGLLEQIEDTDPPKLIFRVPLAPEVDLGDYRALRAPYKWSAPGKKELETALTNMRQMYAITETVERAIEVGDFVLVDVKGALTKPQNGDDLSEALSRIGYALVIRKDGENEWPYPGFSKELAGLQSGESKIIKHKFSKETDDETLRGKTASFEVTVKNVRSMSLPDLDDEFAKMTGAFETLEELKAELMEDIKARSMEKYEQQYFDNLFKKIKAGATIKYPPQLVDEETEHVIERLRKRLASQGLELETYLKMQDTDLQTFTEKEAKPIAIQRVEQSLILDQLIEAENIQADEASLHDEFEQVYMELQDNGFDLSKVEGGRQGRQEVGRAIAIEAANRLLTRRALERLKAIATGQLEQQQTEDEKKPKKASAGKGSRKNAQETDGDEDKTSKTEATPSAEKKPKSPSKKSAQKTASE
ncbi:MAG: trigger factor [Anaerolineales bacterium]